ncbi:MAG: DMT family transporter, partial [Chloroflexi bacterium]|nr:DMT family transporter [Chloroflexota bacterium]
MGKDRLGYLYIILASLGFGVLPILVKFSFANGAAPMQVQSLRYLLAALAGWVVVLVIARHELRHFSRRFLVYLVLQCICGVAADSMYAIALSRMEASLVAVLYYAYPVFIALLVFFILKERFGRMRLAALAITIAGCALVVGIDPTHPVKVDGLGAALIITAAFVIAVATIFIQKMSEEKSVLVVVTTTCSLSALGFAVMAPPTFILTIPTAGNLLLLIGPMAVFSTVAPFALYVLGLKYIGASNAAIVAAAELVVALAASYLFLGERLALLQLFGAVLIMSAGVLLQR